MTPDDLEHVRREGPDFYAVRRLHELTDVARQTGLERDDFANALIAHAIGLCRPDATSRKVLAAVLVKEARRLDSDAVDEAMMRSQW